MVEIRQINNILLKISLDGVMEICNLVSSQKRINGWYGINSQWSGEGFQLPFGQSKNNECSNKLF